MATKKKQHKSKLSNVDLGKAIRFYSNPQPKNKGGRPKKYGGTLDPIHAIAVPNFFSNPKIEPSFFWEVFLAAKTSKGRKFLRNEFDRWESAIEEAEAEAKTQKKNAIKIAELKFKIAQQKAKSSRKELGQLKQLADDVEFKLPDLKASQAYTRLIRCFARKKREQHQWRKLAHKSLPQKYQKLNFYQALADFFFDAYGKRYSPNTIRKDIKAGK